MNNTQFPSGVYAAAVTPLKSNLIPDLDGLVNLINFLARRGCHGILLTGTTGEGPSFSIAERESIYQVAVNACQDLTGFRLLAGTGTPSLDDTILITKTAFNLGLDGVVVLPPYYYRKATDEGLFSWFSQVIKKSVPRGGVILGYHIPPVSGVSLDMDLIARLQDKFPDQFIGIKDSSGDPALALELGKRFGSDICVLNGNDKLFSLALKSRASGCITAMANLISPLHRKIWDDFNSGIEDTASQEKVDRIRELSDRHPPMPPLIKMLLAQLHSFPHWSVKPPLLDFNPDLIDMFISEYTQILD